MDMEQREQRTAGENAAGENAAGENAAEKNAPQENGSRREDTLSLEEAMEQLSEVLAALDGGDQTLEEAFASYQKGIGLVRLCSSKIDRVEKQCRIITESGEEYDL